MAKRGRKPSNNKNYFTQEQEEAIVKLKYTKNQAEKDKIFKEKLYFPLIKMIESIIRTYKYYIPDESFEDTLNDCMSNLIVKIDFFDESRGTKAYSYCGTVCKRYLIFKCMQYVKNRNRTESFEKSNYDFGNDSRYLDDNGVMKIQGLNDLINDTSNQVEEMIKHREVYNLSDNDYKVGVALIELLRNSDEIMERMGSNKLNKSLILAYMRDTTLLTTNEIGKSMKKYKEVYKANRKNNIDDIYN